MYVLCTRQMLSALGLDFGLPTYVTEIQRLQISVEIVQSLLKFTYALVRVQAPAAP